MFFIFSRLISVLVGYRGPHRRKRTVLAMDDARTVRLRRCGLGGYICETTQHRPFTAVRFMRVLQLLLTTSLSAKALTTSEFADFYLA